MNARYGMNVEEWPQREAPSIPVRPRERHVRHGPGAAGLFPLGHSDPVIPVRLPHAEVDCVNGIETHMWSYTRSIME